MIEYIVYREKTEEKEMKEWEKNIRKVVPYTPGEQPKEKDIIKLNTNENPYPPSPRVLEAKTELEQLKFYPDPAAHELVEAIAGYHGLKDDQVFVGVGSDDILAMSFLTFFNSEKPVFSRILHIAFMMYGQICSRLLMRRRNWKHPYA